MNAGWQAGRDTYIHDHEANYFSYVRVHDSQYFDATYTLPYFIYSHNNYYA